MSGLTALCLLLLQCGVQGFGILPGDSMTHQAITESAILNITVHVCRALALAEGKDFAFPSTPFTTASVVAACEAPKSSKSFYVSILQIKTSNWLTDIRKVLSARSHFDDETFIEGRKLITEGLRSVKAANKKESYFRATFYLGATLHTLQDFYSHSNWVEMGNKVPNSNLIKEGTSVGNIADKNRATCRNCDGDDCRNNILEDILQEKILTSGYFALVFSKKLPGKCSHGNFPDATRNTEPKGGINKDKFSSSHGHLHLDAANLAIAATSELLEDVRGAAGDKQFLQMLGISRRSSKTLCFVIDTTGSMSDDIAAVRSVTSSIIDSKVGTEDEPSSYVLVPFNDPDFGPLMRTTDPKVFKTSINSLTATGGGDETRNEPFRTAGTPSTSEIFLFTDATAKDEHLKNTVIALIEQTKTTVNFMITNVLSSRRRRQADNNQQQNLRMARADTQLYRDLAQVSGGQAIEVSKNQLLEATSIITESTSFSLVVLLQVSRNPGKAENLTFSVDESVTNLTIYITGTSVEFTLIDPSGVPQNITNTTGSSVISSQSVGNFQTLQLQAQVGVWEIRMISTNPYSLKVVGQSPIDFLFNFVKELQAPFEGFDLIDNRPIAGSNVSLMVTLIGSDSATVTEVTLVESSGSAQVNGSVTSQGGGEFIVSFGKIPSVEFVVLVKGQSNNRASRAASGTFQRQSSTSLRASTLSVTAGDTDFVLQPGTSQSVPFSVVTSSGGGTFSIQATNDQGFTLAFPSSLSLDAGGSADGTVNITAPSNTPSGTAVTLTIEAVTPGGADSNYAVLLFTVLQPVTDFTQPVCQLLSLQANCSENCNQTMWTLSINITDGVNGSGVDRVSLREGSGTLNSTTQVGSENTILVSYVASCCSPDVQLVAVDRVGNVEICSYTVRTSITQAVIDGPATTAAHAAATTTSSSTRAVQSLLLCFCISVLGFFLQSGV